MLKHFTLILSLFIFMSLSVMSQSCSDNKNEPEIISKRTVLVYAIATNSLNGYDDEDIDEMKKAIVSIGDTDCRLLVYRVSYNNAVPKLFEIYNNNGKAATRVLKEYDATTKQSVTTRRMNTVIRDVISLAPANDYGLVLWSHSLGWALTKSAATDNRLRNFGEDYGATMPIDSLAYAIPDNTFSFIWADACYMGSIEIAYELKNDTHYFIGSPTETISYGMPYDMNVPCFFSDKPDLKKACANVYDFYNALTGEYRSATICLVDCTKLDAVAAACKKIDIANKNIDTSTLQCYNSSSNRFFFDFLQTYKQIASESDYNQLLKAYNQAVIYKAATPKFIGMAINPDNFSGLSTYVMGSSTTRNEQSYKQLMWYKSIY